MRSTVASPVCALLPCSCCSVCSISLPWLRWDGRQAVLFDLPARKFYVFGLTFWPAGLLLADLPARSSPRSRCSSSRRLRDGCGAVTPARRRSGPKYSCGSNASARAGAISASSSMSGRGRARRSCASRPSSSSGSRCRCGPASRSSDSSRRSSTSDTRPRRCSLGGWEGFWILFYGFATYGNAGYMREQVCKYMCPYARFQSAMFDPRHADHLLRCNARRAARRAQAQRRSRRRWAWATASHAMPACRFVRPASTSATACRSSASPVPRVHRCLRFRDGQDGLSARPDPLHDRERAGRIEPGASSGHARLIYAVLLLALLGAFAFGVSHRSPVIFDVLHDRNALYRETADGGIENGYAVKLVNKTDRAQQLSISLEGDELQVCASSARRASRSQPEQSRMFRSRCAGTRTAFKGRHRVDLLVRSDDEIRFMSNARANSSHRRRNEQSGKPLVPGTGSLADDRDACSRRWARSHSW